MVITTKVEGRPRYRTRDEVLLDAVAVFNSSGTSYAKRSSLSFLLFKMKTDPTFFPPEIEGVIDLESEAYLVKAAELILAEFPADTAESFRLLVRTLNAHRLT